MTDTEVREGGAYWEIETGKVWQAYRQALEHLDQLDWSQMPTLLAEVETTLRAPAGQRQLWRALLGQALLYWHAGVAGPARLCAVVALRVAEDADDSFAIGCVACQLSSMALGHGDYQAAADYLARAQLALDMAGMAPPGGVLATAAQLCAEIIHWQEGFARGRIAQPVAEAAIAEAQRDLLGRLRQTSEAMRAAWASQESADEDAPIAGCPTLPPPAVPALSHTAAARLDLRARLARWWRRVLHASGAPGDENAPRSPDGTVRPLEAIDSAAATASAQGPYVSASRDRAPPTAAPLPEPPHIPAPRPAGLAVYCFGNFRVYLDDIPVDRWESARGRTIFKYLVARRDTPAPKELLAGLFWPDSEPELARRSVHQAIYCLRQTFKRLAPSMQIIQFVEDHYQIDPAVPIWIDSEAFKQTIEQARSLETAGEVEQAMQRYTMAVDLYSGEFLAEERYEAWAEEPRCAYQAMYLGALHRLARHYHERGDHSATIRVCQRALAQEDCDEESHRLLLACYGAQGLRHLAVRQYQLYVHTLQTELGLSPSAEMVAFYRQIVGAGSESHSS
jgi:DNA-binding SARP family transcriptional activator